MTNIDYKSKEFKDRMAKVKAAIESLEANMLQGGSSILHRLKASYKDMVNLHETEFDTKSWDKLMKQAYVIHPTRVTQFLHQNGVPMAELLNVLERMKTAIAQTYKKHTIPPIFMEMEQDEEGRYYLMIRIGAPAKLRSTLDDIWCTAPSAVLVPTTIDYVNSQDLRNFIELDRPTRKHDLPIEKPKERTPSAQHIRKPKNA